MTYTPEQIREILRDPVIKQIRMEDMERAARCAQRPRVRLSEMAAELGCHKDTVRRRMDRYDIPERDAHGHIYSGDGDIFISRIEWESKRPLPTQTVVNYIERKTAGHTAQREGPSRANERGPEDSPITHYRRQ